MNKIAPADRDAFVDRPFRGATLEHPGGREELILPDHTGCILELTSPFHID